MKVFQRQLIHCELAGALQLTGALRFSFLILQPERIRPGEGMEAALFKAGGFFGGLHNIFE